jgi:carbon storage regulator
MLVLTRRVGEEIVIGGDIRVTVLAVNGLRVRIGIMAPPSITVLRGELVEADAEVAAMQAVVGNAREACATANEPDKRLG